MWPEAKEDRVNVERLFSLSMPFYPRIPEGGSTETLDIIRVAARELAIHRCGSIAAASPFPPDAVAVQDVSEQMLRAWRSAGLFPGLNNFEVLDASAAHFISAVLPQPYAFTHG